jgi:hypothetical protein
MKALKFLGTLPVLMGVLFGCASTQSFPTYTHKDTAEASSSPETNTSDGLHVSAKWLEDKDTTKRHFGVDVSKGNLLIIWCRFENKSPDRTFLLIKTNFIVMTGGAPGNSGDGKDVSTGITPGRPDGSGGSSSALSASAPFAAFGLLVGGLQFMGEKGAERDALMHNFQVQELRDRTLSPGQSAEGCLYYSLTRAMRSAANLALAFSVTGVPDQKPTCIKLELERKQPL